MKMLLSRNVVALGTTLAAALWILLFLFSGWFNDSWVYVLNQVALGASLAALTFTAANRKPLEACLVAAPWLIAMVGALIGTLCEDSLYLDLGEAMLRAVLFSLMPFAAMGSVMLVARIVPEVSRQPWAILTALGVQWVFAVCESFFTWASVEFKLWMVLTSGAGNFTIVGILGFAAAYVLCVKCSKA
ncbi:MAG: hypothetical protein IJD01_08110 [Clostridia bacterium]|nr:hypothetical protein [Clostridia bacterium]